MNITITGDNYNNYIGKYTGAMISKSDDDFTIIFQSKDEVLESIKNKTSNVESVDEVIIPLLLLNDKEDISSCVPNVRILYNNNLNTESILSGYLLGKIFRHEDISEISDIISSNINELLEDESLSNELKPLIVNAEYADDFDFSKIEDEMFDVIDKKIKSL